MKFMTNLDLNKNQLLNAVLQQLSSAPASPVAGQMYQNTTDKRTYAFNGTAWVDMTVANAGTLINPTMTGLPKIRTSVTKSAGNSTTEAFRIESSDAQPLFQVKTNGDTVLAGILTVNGTGTSSFAGDVAIGGNLNVAGSTTGGTKVDLAKDLTVDGKLVVKGDTDLGDDASIDKVNVKALTTVYSKTTKALGNKTDDTFRVVDSAGANLFNVKTNGDTVIGGVLTVNGTGTSSFAGDVSIGGSLTVDGTITGGTKVDLADDMVVSGNLNVKGNTLLGDDANADTTTIKGVTKIFSKTTKALGSATANAFHVVDSAGSPLFEVRENGNTVIAGVLTVNGTGDSTFAGNVNIGGSLVVDGSITGGAKVNLGDDLEVIGALNVKGHTFLGDNSAQDIVTIKSLTNVYSPVLKSAGVSTANVFAVKDSGGADLLAVKQNGDTVIAGVLKVDGTGTSTFTGDVSIGGSLTVAQSATVTANLTGNNFNIAGNLSVSGNTTLGDATADVITINGTPTFKTDVAMSNKKITNLADPVSGQDAATKNYVDSVSQGLDVLQSVRVATTANITLSAVQTIDGIAVVAGNRVLVKNQTDAKTNGVYIVQTGAWTRSTDADTSVKVTPGMFTFVEEGTANADSGWVLSTDGAITLGTTLLSFVQFSGAGSINAGNGIVKTGNTLEVVGTANRIISNASNIDIASTYVGQTSITTLGTVGTGTWNATTIALAKGGTGATNAVTARANLGATGKFAQAIGDGTATTFTITHNLASDDVVVSVKEVSTGNHVIADIQTVDANTVKVYFGTAPTASSYKVVVVG